VSLNPTADAHVEARNPSQNYATDSTLEVDGSPVKIVYMKFDLASLAGKSVVSAILRFRVCTWGGCKSSSTQVVKQVDNTSWSETGITYNNRPPVSTTINIFNGGSYGEWKEIDILSYVNSRVGQLMSVGVDSTGSDGLDFYSKEASDKPELVVEYVAQ